MGTTRNMLYDATDINHAARERVEMLSVRPSPGEQYQMPCNKKVARNGAIFCAVMVALLVATWGLFL